MACRTPWLVPGLFLLASGTAGCGIEATGDLDAAAQQSLGGQGGSAGASPGVGGSLGGVAGDNAGSGGDGGSKAGAGGNDSGAAGDAGAGGDSGSGGTAGDSGEAGESSAGGEAGAGEGGEGGAGAGGSNGGGGGASGGMAGDGGVAGDAGIGGDAGAAGDAGAGGQMTTLCEKANEETPPKSMTLTCPPNEVIVEIVFASYGLPKGDCGSFSQDACHAASSKAKVEALCLQKNSCEIDANNATFGDPCKGAGKRLFVEVKCGAPSPTCGDGALDPGEACDAGGATTMACSDTCGLTCTGGFLSDDNGSCYSITKKKSWQAARQECVAKGEGCDLVVLETAAERSFLKGKFDSSEAWVGGIKSDSGWLDMPAYTWVDFSPWTGGGPAAKWVANKNNGGGPDGASWVSGEPNNVLSERCLRLKDSDLKLLTSKCDTEQVGICECKVPKRPCNHDGTLDPGEECDDGNLINGDGCSTGCTVECAPLDAAHFTVKDPASGHCYAALKQETPWNNAGNACSALGPRYHLARVDSLAEFQFLSVASWARFWGLGGPKTPDLWLDGNDQSKEGSFVTSLGEQIPFENKKFPWATGEPNNAGKEDCLSLRWFTLDGSTAYLLNDAPCGWKMRPLCERE